MRIDPEAIDRTLESLHEALHARDFKAAAELAQSLSTTRIGEVLTTVAASVAAQCLAAMDPRRAGRTLTRLPPEFSVEVLEALPASARHAVYNGIPPDHLAGLLDALDEETRATFVAELDTRLREHVADIARYDERSAGRMMSPFFVSVEEARTVRQTLDALLDAPPEVERTPYIYIHDATGKLTGAVSIKDLLRAEPARPVREVMVSAIVMVHTQDPAIEAATLLRNRRLTMLPVLDDQDRLAGVITFDDAMTLLARETAGLITAAGAVTSEESFFTPPMTAIKGRLPWMAANVFLNMGAVAVITGFEETIATVAILAAFIPMITDMGGNVGIQSLSVAIRSIALGEARLRDLRKALRKEILIGVVNGLALGLLFAIIAFFMRGNPMLALLAGVALGINVLVAGIVGGVLPFLIRALGKDPAMMTGPLLTTITDITGVSIYLGLSTAFILRLGG